MPAYATVQDIIDRYGERTLWDLLNGEGETLDHTPVEQALADASEEVDASLRGRYALPLANVPAVVRRLAIDLALAMLPTEAAGDNDLVQERAKAARKMLDAVRKGDVDLGLAAPTTSVGSVTFVGPGMVFTSDRLKDL